MRAGAGVIVSATVLLAACGVGVSAVKPMDEVDVESWRAYLVDRQSAPDDPDMHAEYLGAVADCDGTVDELVGRMVGPTVDPALVLVGVSYVCPGQQPKVVEAMRELQNAPTAP